MKKSLFVSFVVIFIFACLACSKPQPDTKFSSEEMGLSGEYYLAVKKLISSGHYIYPCCNGGGPRHECLICDYPTDFPVEKHKVETSVIVVSADKNATPEKVMQYMEENGLRPARIEELVGFTQQYPNYPEVIALGSIYTGIIPGSRGSYLSSTIWMRKTMFLAFHK